MRRFKPVLLAAAGLAGLLLLGVAGLVVRAASAPSRQLAVEPVPVTIDAHRAARNLADALAIPTLSRQDGAVDAEAWARLHALLAERFPLVHAELERREVAEHSAMYTWPGSDPSLPPLILMAHLDVVPADPEGWTVHPFSGEIRDGFVWGRGALDDKNNALGQLEAVEHLLARGFQPRRTVFLAYGHDEEVAGIGAGAIADIVADGPAPWLVVDEGGTIVTDAIAGLGRPAALVGIAEKGYATIELTARDAGGHSSMPPPHTAAGRIGAAVARVEDHPMPAAIDGPAALMMDWLGPEMSWPMRAVYVNRDVFAPVIVSQMTKKVATNAQLRTTAAVTMLEGSPKENVLPRTARARMNFRIFPGDTVEGVVAHVREAVDDPSIEVRADAPSWASSPPSRVDGPAFEALQRSIHEAYPEVVVAPYLVLGFTDARHYDALSDSVYRFSPMIVQLSDLERIHGVDERISVETYGRLVGFYVRLLENAAAGVENAASGG